MRRVMLAVFAALSLTLAACGDDEDTGSGSGAAAGGPVTIETQFGTAEIPADPERVVTVGFGEDDYAYAFGIDPVAIRTFLGDFDASQRSWLPEGAVTPVQVGADDINFEKVAAANPDVILGVYSFIDQTTYDKLAQIAPTVVGPKGAPESGIPWQEQTRIDGKALGKDEEAERLIADVEQQFTQAAEDHPEFEGKTIAVTLTTPPDGYYVLEDEDPRARFFTDLGFENAPKTGAVSGERVDLLDQDVLVILGKEADAVKNPAFRKLEAVREGRVLYVPLDTELAGAIGFASPLSLPVALEEAVPKLSALL